MIVNQNARIELLVRFRRFFGDVKQQFNIRFQKERTEIEKEGKQGMKKEKIRKIIEEGVNFQQLCRVFFKYEEAYRYYFPLKTGEKLFLGAEEDDFIIDGYSVRRFRDIKKVQKRKISALKSIVWKEIRKRSSFPM